METLEQPILAGFEEALQSFPQAYPASQPPLPGSAEARAMTVGSGAQCAMWLESSSPLGAFSRILLGSSLWTNSEEYCYVWNRLDTRFALSAFQLTPLGQSTGDSGCSLWQTPVADDAMDRIDGKVNSRGEPKLSAQVKLWPTARATDWKAGNNKTGRSDQAQSDKAGWNLLEAAKLWPTPNQRDWKMSGMDTGEDWLTQKMHSTKRDVSPRGSGSLNPRFVCELMGFEADHTNLKHWETLSSHNKPTRSSRRSPKSKGVCEAPAQTAALPSGASAPDAPGRL